MSGFELDVESFIKELSTKEAKALNAGVISMEDSVDDLGRISSEIAPIKLSPLRKSVRKTVGLGSLGIVGEVTFGVTETSKSGRFNYALWIHEADYNLGEQSLAAPGTDGYAVGNKYLERPLKGESDKYIKWWAESIARVLKE